MSTTDRPPEPDSASIELLPNQKQGTVTFVADRGEETDPPTEWMTVAAEDTVDLESYR
jgi:hypothetical protein